MRQKEEDIKSGYSIEYIKGAGNDTVEDAYRAIAACAIFQACKDYKAWLVAKHFLAPKMPELRYVRKLACLLWSIADSPRKYIWRSEAVNCKEERERVCIKRIRRVIANTDPDKHPQLRRYTPMFTKVMAYSTGDTANFPEIRRQIFVVKTASLKVLNTAIDIMEGRGWRFSGLDGFFESQQFSILSGGMDGTMIRKEIERQAAEKIKKKEARGVGLPFAYDPEEEGDDEDYSS